MHLTLLYKRQSGAYFSETIGTGAYSSETLLFGKNWAGAYSIGTLDGRNHAIVIAESLGRVVAAIRIASVRWRSYLPRKDRN